MPTNNHACEVVTDALRATLPAYERVIPNGARLSVVRYLSRSSILEWYTRSNMTKRKRMDRTIQQIRDYLGISLDELYAAKLIAHTNNIQSTQK